MLLLWLPLALAQQTGARIEGTDGRVFVDVRWRDVEREDQRLYVTLENTQIDAATGAGDGGLAGCHDAIRTAVLAERARRFSAWKVEVTRPGTSCSVGIKVSGSGDAAAVNAALMEAAEKGKNTFLAERGFVSIDGHIRPDYAAVVPRSVVALAPIAAALRQPGDDAERYAARALSFVQAIPYETEGGYRSPISVVLANRGDCDSKVGLFAALLRAEFPEVPVGLVLIPGHAFAVVGLTPHLGAERWEDADGNTWILAEPVGPGLLALGKIGKRSQEVAEGERRVVRVF